MDDNDLLNQAIALHYHDITAAVARRGHVRGSEADIVHDLYLKLAVRPGILRNKSSIGAFLCRAAINLGIDRLRRQNFEARLFSGTEVEAENVAADTLPPDHWLQVEARLRLLRQAIGELSERRRAVFILHRLHGLSSDQIAARLGITRNMVDRHLRMALAHCLDRLSEEAG
ncbi:RNA polymerase sigma factor [Paracoccus caeni]|uniref:RNA polymerase sigma factor n=1 Tax=Paracoccus caeni TaxID=657651 RepID=A0A934SFH2_9RHOB|nr:RNA polymerase sigma factor [Paracoccus caeni]